MKHSTSFSPLLLGCLLSVGGVLNACGGGEITAPPGGGNEFPGSADPPSATVPNSTVPNSTGAPDPSSPNVEPPPPPKPVEVVQCAAAAVGTPVLRLLSRYEFQNTIDDIFPQVKGAWTNSVPASLLSSQGFDNSAEARVSEQLATGLLETAEAIGTEVSGTALAQILPCSSSGDAACAGEYLDTLGRRLFRRELTQAEKDRYLTLFDSASSKLNFAGGIRWVTAALIQSPNAVYRSEIGTTSASGRTLSALETATELAYTFSGSTPSAELLQQAESNSLGDPVAVAKQLLASERGKSAMQRFFEGYTGYAAAGTKQRPEATTQGVNFSEVSADMVRETRAFIDNVVFTKQGTLQTLLTEATTNPSVKLASYYGLPAPATDYASVARPTGQGVGLLAQASFLASHANTDASSPTQRGVFVFTRLLCNVAPPVPDNVPNLPTPPPGEVSTRQRYEMLHASGGSCKDCHALFDPIGYGFEHFDEAGRYREMEGSFTIDASGSVSVNGSAVAFTGQEQLAQALSEDGRVSECFSAFLSTYAFGTTQSCLGASQVAALKSGTLGVADAFATLAAEPHFTQRSAQ